MDPSLLAAETADTDALLGKLLLESVSLNFQRTLLLFGLESSSIEKKQSREYLAPKSWFKPRNGFYSGTFIDSIFRRQLVFG